jgi:hypothetical protein
MVTWVTYLGHRSRLVIPPDELNSAGISELEARQERYGLDAKESPVDVIT